MFKKTLVKFKVKIQDDMASIGDPYWEEIKGSPFKTLAAARKEAKEYEEAGYRIQITEIT